MQPEQIMIQLSDGIFQIWKYVGYTPYYFFGQLDLLVRKDIAIKI